MARLQILELPEGTDDSRPPFVLVVDESMPQRVILGMDHGYVGDYWQSVAEQIGARGVIVTPETVEIPANDVSAEVRAGLQESVGELYESARQSLSESETLGHQLLQRAENAEGRARAMEVQRDRANSRAKEAEAGRVAADDMLRAVCEVFGGPQVDPVVRAREVLAQAKHADVKLLAFAEAQEKELVDRMDEITDALGLDRLRDWGEIVAAAKRLRPTGDGGEVDDGAPLVSMERAEPFVPQPLSLLMDDADGGHRFDVPGYQDPIRCAQCGMDGQSWLTGRDRRSCDQVQADAKSGHDFRPLDPGGLACLRCGIPRVKWAASLLPQDCDAVKEAG
ncbi:hypothetical protein AB0P07_08290 [Streptomyces sp. NPDC085944]|uniref:hypothetical protein n=1 Tax=Streptomyces sp. NPDC085944 TaxID=3154962 RepID=UPI003440AFF7